MQAFHPYMCVTTAGTHDDQAPSSNAHDGISKAAVSDYHPLVL